MFLYTLLLIVLSTRNTEENSTGWTVNNIVHCNGGQQTVIILSDGGELINVKKHIDTFLASKANPNTIVPEEKLQKEDIPLPEREMPKKTENKEYNLSEFEHTNSSDNAMINEHFSSEETVGLLEAETDSTSQPRSIPDGTSDLNG